jgi:hypothetical protein
MRTLPIGSAPQAVRASLSPSRMVTVCGDRAWTLGQHLAAQMAGESTPVLYLCGDNRFDPYRIAKLVRMEQKSAEEALRRILVARAFTAYQLDELIHRLNADGGFSTVVISGIVSAFYDEDVAPNDAARLFYRSLWKLAALAREGLSLLLTQSESPKRAARNYFLNDLCRASSVVIRLEGEHSFTLERRGGRLTIADSAPRT